MNILLNYLSVIISMSVAGGEAPLFYAHFKHTLTHFGFQNLDMDPPTLLHCVQP